MKLEVEGLNKSFAGTQVLSGVSFTLQPGVTALLGPNGAGKTTLLRVMAGLVRPDAGSVIWDSRHVGGDDRAYHAQLGYLPQDFSFVPGQAAHTFLHYMGNLKGLSPAVCERQIPAVLTLMGLSEDANRPLVGLSGGQRRRAGLAQALLGKPQLLFLDEPTVGLDPEERQRILTLLTTLGRNRVILVSTHIASDAETLGDNLLILRAGRIVFSGKAQMLNDRAAGHVWEVTAPAGTTGVDALVASGRVSQVAVSAGMIRLRCVGDLPAGFAAKPVSPSLEDAYLLNAAGAGHSKRE